jgi:hypothetical protein
MTEAPMPCCGRDPCRTDAPAAPGEEERLAAVFPEQDDWDLSGRWPSRASNRCRRRRAERATADANGEHPGKTLHDLAQRSF